jgi:Spy/CpxP family protein refolding chaperone
MQITLQRRGLGAAENPEVASALKLTDEQQDKIKTIQEDTRKEMQELFQGGNREEARKKMAEIRKSTEEKLQSILTAEQKGKWKELTGEPFKGEITPPRFGGGERPGRGKTDR